MSGDTCETPIKEALFTRAGTPAPARARVCSDGARRFYSQPRRCGRCGGAGGAEKWAHTGWTCYQCGGRGTDGIERVPLYTRERLDKLVAAQAKRDAKRVAAAEARAAAEKAEADAKRDAFEAAHADVLPWLRSEVRLIEERTGYGPGRAEGFLPELLYKADRFAEWSEKQAAAVRASKARQEAEQAARAASRHVGAVGERLTAQVTVERVHTCYGTDYLGKTSEFYIVTMRDGAGNALVSKSGSFRPEKGASLSIKGTVKDHSSYNGEAQTNLSRVVDVAADAARKAKLKAEKAQLANSQLIERVKAEMTGGIWISGDLVKSEPGVQLVHQRNQHGGGYAALLVEGEGAWKVYSYTPTAWAMNWWNQPWSEALAGVEPLAEGPTYSDAAAAALTLLRSQEA